jgi:hypothetical protein
LLIGATPLKPGFVRGERQEDDNIVATVVSIEHLWMRLS